MHHEKEFTTFRRRVDTRKTPSFGEIFKSVYENNEQHSIQIRIQLAERIILTHRDANEYLRDICKKNWSKHRAVVFLDPFGMEVTWETIEAIAKTQAIDLWLLFPLGQAINRLLRRDGEINAAIKRRLDDCFGTDSWYDHFYKIHQENTLFGNHSRIRENR